MASSSPLHTQNIHNRIFSLSPLTLFTAAVFFLLFVELSAVKIKVGFDCWDISCSEFIIECVCSKWTHDEWLNWLKDCFAPPDEFNAGFNEDQLFGIYCSTPYSWEREKPYKVVSDTTFAFKSDFLSFFLSRFKRQGQCGDCNPHRDRSHRHLLLDSAHPYLLQCEAGQRGRQFPLHVCVCVRGFVRESDRLWRRLFNLWLKACPSALEHNLFDLWDGIHSGELLIAARK